jgi:hypothetical protein
MAKPLEIAEKDITTWNDGKQKIPFDKMSPRQLQKAKLSVQKTQLRYHHSMNILSILVEKLDEEAEKRGLTLKEFESDYHKKRAEYKSREKAGLITQESTKVEHEQSK